MRRTSALYVCACVIASGFALSILSAAPPPPASSPGALTRALFQTSQNQGDPTSLAGSGQAVGIAATAFVEPQTIVSADAVPIAVAEARNAEIRALQAAHRGNKPRPYVPVPVGTTARPATADQPPTAAAAEAIPGASSDLPLATTDLRYFHSHNITGTEVATSQRSTIMEPTAINVGTAVFYTGNWYAAKSTDSGATFSYVNPYTFFPSVNGGFCCDQVTAYAPSQDMAIWGLQYVDDGVTNTLRIARAIGSAGVASNSWVYWDFTPQLVGFASGVWFDYPSMTVGANMLYVSSNAYLTSNNSFAGNVLMRISLAELAAGGGIGFQYFKSNIGTERITEGAGTTVYWAGFATTTQMRIHRWDEASGTIFWDNVNLNAFNWLNRDGNAASPDGTNWALRADSRPTAAYVAGGIIGVMWTAKEGTGRPKPYTVHARFNEATRALVSQADIWHTNYAWMYPSAMPNSAGNLAGTLQIGGDASGAFAYPGTQVWVTDDITGASTTVGALYFLSAGNDGPNNNAWGDYFTVRRHKTRPGTWIAASHFLVDGGAGANAVPNYLWFGRERDNPTPASITSPSAGSTLPGASATFFWSAGYAASQYWLYVGTTGVGSANVVNENQGLNTSRVVSGLPTMGGTVYVRLWTLLPAGWSFVDFTYAGSTICMPAAITSPVPGSRLPGASVPFTWNTGGSANAQYWLYVGTTLGGTQVWNENQTTGVARTVTGVPTNGLPIYARLWSLCGGWSFRDETYTAAGIRAHLISPINHGVLTGASQTFTWSTGTGSSSYWLYVGTSPGGSDILSENQGVNLSRTLTGLPVDGKRIYLRLWSLVSGVWYYSDYDFTASGTTRARLSAPAEGSVLAGATANFSWLAGTGSTQYWIHVGNAPGGADLLNQNLATSLNVAAAGLPTDRRPIYLRLWSLAGGVWVYNDYVFRSYDGGATRGRLTNPADGSTLVGTNTTFAWSAGSGTTQYWLYVGTAPGTATLLNQNQGTALSTLVTGLPTNGARIYIRLWSLVGGVWVFNDYDVEGAP